VPNGTTPNGTAAAAARGPLPQALFYFTDEKDSAYLHSLGAVARDFASVAVHGDAEARAQLLRSGVPHAEEDRHLA
jgi:hypothetical protein